MPDEDDDVPDDILMHFSREYMKTQAALPSVDTEHAQGDFFFAAPDADHVASVLPESPAATVSDSVEIAIGAPLTCWVYPEVEFIRRPRHDEVYVIRIYTSGKREIVVEREMNVLTLDEAREHEAEVRQAIKDELQRWISLGAFKRFLKDQAKT